MISVRIKAPLLTYWRHYFADRPSSGAASGLSEFSCCRCLGAQPLFRRRAEYTKLIELRTSGRELLEAFPKQCRYEIRRAERDGVRCAHEVDFHEYFAFHAEFCRSKNRPAPSWEFFSAHERHLLVTKAMVGSDTLCMHAYLIDLEGSCGRLFTSSSLFRQENDSTVRAMSGRANRYLHYWDMQEIAAQGLQIYDFGGYARDTSDPVLAGINEFKDSFGGTLAEQSTYVSMPLALSRRAAALMRGLRLARTAPGGDSSRQQVSDADSGLTRQKADA